MQTAEPVPEIGAEGSQGARSPGLWKWLVGGTMLLFIALILAAFGLRPSGRSDSVGGFGVNSIGRLGQFKPRPAPTQTLHFYDGSQLSLSELRGQTVVRNFWGSWWAPYREEAPALERVWQASRDRGVQFIGVNLWDAESDGRRFIEQQRITYPNALDPTGQLAIELGVTGLPETYFINPEGQIVQRWIGPLTAERLTAFVDQVRAPSSAAISALEGVAP